MTKTTFIETSAHKRFVEFAKTVHKGRTIGLCYGPAGVGKTLSARRYAKWDIAEPLLESWGPPDPSDEKVYAALERSRTVFYTPPGRDRLRGNAQRPQPTLEPSGRLP